MSRSSELIYTSAPQGLRPGSRGFCTVAMSESMPAGLVGPLESLSAYRPADGQGPAPINHMHVQLKVAGRAVNVLSRVAEAPPDYTGRTNKIAHHVVVVATDQTEGGPAAVLRQPGFAAESWDGEVRKIAEPKSIPPVDSPARVAQTWANQIGDAGWAGTVASIFENRAPGPPLYLLYRPEQNAALLALIDEAICLLPDPKRWNATFSTHAGELPPGVQCRLRCLIAGSSEASALPPAAMTLDLANGELHTPSRTVNAPPPGPLVNAARTGKLVAFKDVTPHDLMQHDLMQAESSTPTPDLQPGNLVDAIHPDPFQVDRPYSNVSLPPSTPPPRTRPPAPQAEAQSTQNIALPLVVAAVLFLCLGGAALLFLVATKSNESSVDPMASAGIKNGLEAVVSRPLETEAGVAQGSEQRIETVTADADATAGDVKQVKAESMKRQPFEELAKNILKGEGFLVDKNDHSFVQFSGKVKQELKLLAEQLKQLHELSPQPANEQLNEWLRAKDGMEQLTSFFDARKKEIETLKQHPPLKALQTHRERLTEKFRAWSVDAKKWEDEKNRQPEMFLQIPDGRQIDEKVELIRATENEHLQESMSNLLNEYERLVTEKQQFAAGIEKQFEPLQKELAADLQRRRDSHRLAIYFDRNSRRVQDRLRLKPRCFIALKPDELKAINRLSVEESKPIPVGKSGDEVKLPGKFEGWLTVGRVESGIILKLNPQTITPSVRKRYPLLQQLDQFIQQQDATFESIESLSVIWGANQGTVRSEISRARSKLGVDETNAGKRELLDSWGNAMEKVDGLLRQSPKAKLDDLYITQTGQIAADLKLHQSHVDKAFEKNGKADIPIGEKIGEHVTNLEKLREEYRQLKANTDLLDFEGELVFGNASGTRLGQSSFETVETFDLFFFPELVYGPPPKE